MKILGQPQVRPDMVFSLLRLIGANDGAMNADEVFAWMGPSVASDATSPTAKKTKELIEHIADVARSLGFIQEERWELKRPAPVDYIEFGYELHDALLATQEWDVIDTYASLIVEIELNGVSWIVGLNATDIANRLGERVQLAASDAPSVVKESANMNPSRWAAWRSWATAAGLGVPGSANISEFFPNPVLLVERVARKHPQLRGGNELTAPDFLKAISKELPYLDGGRRAAVAWERAGDAPRIGGPVSFVLSASLRELHYRKVLELRFEGGDRAGARQLHDDGSELESFATVRLAEEIA